MATSIRIEDSQSGAFAEIAPELGFNCFRFCASIAGQQVDVIDAPATVLDEPQRPSSFGTPLLFPFPNRIEHGYFTWAEQDYQLPLTPNHPHTLHGFCLDRPWRVIEQSEDTLIGEFQLSIDDPVRRECWPADFQIQVRYRVTENRLETQFRIHNPDKLELPWGLGTHPYFKLPFSAESQPSDCVFTVPVEQKWEMDECIPTGKIVDVPYDGPRSGVRFGSEKFDDVFTAWESDGQTLHCSIMDEKAGIQLSQACDGQVFRDVVIFTPPNRDTVCLEPYSCVTNAINLQSRDLETGLQVLQPGETIQTWIALQVTPVFA